MLLFFYSQILGEAERSNVYFGVMYIWKEGVLNATVVEQNKEGTNLVHDFSLDFCRGKIVNVEQFTPSMPKKIKRIRDGVLSDEFTMLYNDSEFEKIYANSVLRLERPRKYRQVSELYGKKTLRALDLLGRQFIEASNKEKLLLLQKLTKKKSKCWLFRLCLLSSKLYE